MKNKEITPSNTNRSRLMVVSNRLPFTIVRGADGNYSVHPASGGLVSAMLPALKNRGGVWVGWPGVTGGDNHDLEAMLGNLTEDTGYTLKPVMLSAEEQHGFYHGFSNEIIWPLFHDLFSNCHFDPDYWDAYLQVNRKFAQTVFAMAKPQDFIWVHDYHLMEVARELRKLGYRSQLGFFLHIPFPPLDIFLKLPWRFEILCALLEFDLIGFQTLRDQRNFTQCVETLIKGSLFEGEGQIQTLRLQDQEMCRICTEEGNTEKEIRVGTFPIGIDFKSFDSSTASTAVRKQAVRLHEDLQGRKMILGIDRLDYTKGIISKLNAFRCALERHPDLIQRVRLVQHIVPSRVDIPEYQAFKLKVERLISEINGEFTRSDWVPIHYLHGSLSQDELLAYYRAADIALVTPLKDGMNLVAKEYCAAHVENGGVLILSEFAGSAAQLKDGALLVNPYDIENMAEGIYEAFNMSNERQAARMQTLRSSIADSDVFSWVDSFLQAVIEKDLSYFPVVDDYIPSPIEHH